MHISNQIKSFQYLGGKFSVLPWLLPKLPECNHFVDVMGGSGVVMLNRDPSPIETYNDINHQVVNFFRVLKYKPLQLISLLELTPHSRYEYDQAWDNAELPDVERAVNFFIRTQQSIYAAGAQDKVKGWATAISERRTSISEKTHKWIRAVENLWEVSERLKQTQIECRDFRFVMKAYDHKDTLLFLDSPYDMTMRSSTKYMFDFKEQDFHDMHYWAKKAVAKVAVTGYNTGFMKTLFKDFNYHEGPKRKNNKSAKQALECLWTNY
jgi:DNA adenine methylase